VAVALWPGPPLDRHGGGGSARAGNEVLPPAMAWRQAQAEPPVRDGGDPRRPPRMSPDEARRAELDRLFAALRDAPDEAGAALVEARIWALWAQAASPSVQLLMRRGLHNMEARAPEEALEDFDAAITLAPDFAEAWHRRAQAHAAAGDLAAAARDLREALRLEPRHFGALATLSTIQEEAGDFAGALRSFEAALALHPKMRGAEMRLRDLQRRARGEET
jgi:tetratricopeptide (TPR) repeat protein